MITTDALKYLGDKVSELFRTGECSIVFFCSAGCYLNEIPSNCLARA